MTIQVSSALLWQSDLTDCQSKASSDLSLSYEVQEINSVTWQNCWKLHVSFKQRLIIWFLKLKLCLALYKMQQLQSSKNNIKKTDLAHFLASMLHKETIILISNLNVTLKLEKMYQFSLKQIAITDDSQTSSSQIAT